VRNNLAADVRRMACVLALGIIPIGAGNILAQTPRFLSNPLGQNTYLSGFQFLGVTGSAGYFRSNLSGQGMTAFPGQQSYSDNQMSLGTTLGYTKMARSTSISVIYAPFYFGSLRSSSANSWNHSLNISTGTPRKLSPKVTFDFGVNANIYSFQVFLFSPMGLGQALTSTSNFDELAGAFIRRNTTNDALAAAMGGGQTLDLPTRAMYGDRNLSAGAQASFGYHHSQRLTFTFGAGGMRLQPLPSSNSRQNQQIRFGFAPVNTAFGMAQMTYTLDPRTSIGVSAAVSRPFTRGQDTYTTTVQANAGRILTRSIFVSGYGGIARITAVAATFPVQTAPQYVAGGMIGFRTRNHGFIVSADRTAGDPFGIGSSSNLAITGTWMWSRPGSSWSLYGNFGQQALTSLGASNTRGWRAGGGFSQVLGKGFVLFTDYAYFDFTARLTPLQRSLTSSSVRIGGMWTPHVGLLRQQPQTPLP